MEMLVGFLLGTGGSHNAFGPVFKKREAVGSAFFRDSTLLHQGTALQRHCYKQQLSAET